MFPRCHDPIPRGPPRRWTDDHPVAASGRRQVLRSCNEPPGLPTVGGAASPPPAPGFGIARG